MARRRSRFVRPAKNTMMWFSMNLAPTTVVATTPILLGSWNAAALLLRPFTVIRSRIMVSARSDQFGAVEFQEGAVGFQIVTDSAVAAGIASLPTPISEASADYFIYRPYSVDVTFADATGYGDRSADSTFEIDSKAMRKCGHDDDLAVTAQNLDPTHSVLVSMIGRILIKLH